MRKFAAITLGLVLAGCTSEYVQIDRYKDHGIVEQQYTYETTPFNWTGPGTMKLREYRAFHNGKVVQSKVCEEGYFMLVCEEK